MSYRHVLTHIIVLGVVHAHLAPLIGNAYLRVPVIAVVIFLITYLGVKALSLLPGSKFVVG